MSVLSCNRNGCDNVMCDRYSPTHGYICDECFKELVDSGAATDIDLFMNSDKYAYKKEVIAYILYDDEFKIT